MIQINPSYRIYTHYDKPLKLIKKVEKTAEAEKSKERRK
jgi:hypothetical protein